MRNLLFIPLLALLLGVGPSPGFIHTWVGISVKEAPYNATGNGITDDSSAVHAAMAAAASSNTYVIFPAGSYVINSSYNWPTAFCYIQGAGQGACTLILGSSTMFIDTSSSIQACDISGLTTSGGLGLFRSQQTGINVSEEKKIHDCYFLNYTNCAIQNNGSDEPYWKIYRNTFMGANSTGTIGVALSTGLDSSEIWSCDFLKNCVGVKLRQSGITTNVDKNNFLQFDAGSGSPRALIWLVPYTSTTNAGDGCVISENKFGNENEQSTDYRGIIADAGTGTYNGDQMPLWTTASTNSVVGIQVSRNKFDGNFAIPMFYSTTPNIYSSVINNNIVDGTLPSAVLSFLNCPGSSRYTQDNILWPQSTAESSISSVPFPVCNCPGVATGFDPNAQKETISTEFHSYMGGGQDYNDYIELFNTSGASTWAAGGTATISATPVVDSTGGNDAKGLSVAATNDLLEGHLNNGFNSLPNNLVIGNPTWIEFDLEQSSSNPVSQIQLGIQYDSNGIFGLIKQITVPITWKRYRIPFKFRDNTLQWLIDWRPSGGDFGGFNVGRVRIYHAREPISFGTSYYEALKVGTFSVYANPTPGATPTVVTSRPITVNANPTPGGTPTEVVIYAPH